jgi:N utilization substance protein B
MTEKTAPKPVQNRRKSRELALKGLYSLFMSKCDLKETIRDLMEDADYAKADQAYFRALIEGVMDERAMLDARIVPMLDRSIEELSPIEHAILCISGYELFHDVSIPYRVAINEGVELAKRFGGTDGYKYVNGVLDKLAAEARPEEFSRGNKGRR